MNRSDDAYDDCSDRSASEMSVSSELECPECSKTFSSRYSRDRHVSKFHTSEDENEDMSEDEDEQEDEDENEGEEMEQESDNDDTNVDDDNSPFEDFLDVAHNQHSAEREELIEHYLQEDIESSEEEAKQQADAMLLPKMKKTLKLIFINYIIGMTDKRNTALMKAILKKAREYTDDGFSERAAIKAAVSYCKHMIYELLDS